jgi:hypothetical protein
MFSKLVIFKFKLGAMMTRTRSKVGTSSEPSLPSFKETFDGTEIFKICKQLLECQTDRLLRGII